MQTLDIRQIARVRRLAENGVTAATVHAAEIEVLRAHTGAKLWTLAAGFSRKTIMAKAVANARCERTDHPTQAWKACMAEALTYAWACAYAARGAGNQ